MPRHAGAARRSAFPIIHARRRDPVARGNLLNVTPSADAERLRQLVEGPIDKTPRHAEGAAASASLRGALPVNLLQAVAPVQHQPDGW